MPKLKRKRCLWSTQLQLPRFWCQLQQPRKLCLTVSLSRHLQSPKIDLSDGTGMINYVNKRLNKWRVDDSAWVGGEFSVFAQAEMFADIASVHLIKPAQLVDRCIVCHRLMPTKRTWTTSSVAFGCHILILCSWKWQKSLASVYVYSQRQRQRHLHRSRDRQVCNRETANLTLFCS